MPNTPSSDQLTMTWRPVTDGAGRTRMEATWTCASAHADVAVPTVQAA